MNWSPQQLAAIASVQNWLENPDRLVFKLFGYAGTGKTTLAKELASTVPGKVLFAAYTGKAALVLQKAGCTNASTIHKLVYKPKDRDRSEFERLQQELKVAEEPDKIKELESMLRQETENMKRPSFSLNTSSDLRWAKLLVVDEVSMVGRNIGMDLESFETPILVLGDPAQLPPVGDGNYFTGGKPDVMLKEIHRQAEGNPIISLATTVRQGGQLEPGEYGDSSVLVAREKLDPDLALDADQILCGRNKTRTSINRRMRELLGRTSPWPEAGDRVVCLRNNHELGLLNGQLWVVVDSADPGDGESVCLRLRLEDSELEQEITSWNHYFLGRDLDKPYWERSAYEEFDYGYALTVHKAQGSQWGNVLLFDESEVFRESARKWLYTGITRAAEKVTVIRNR